MEFFTTDPMKPFVSVHLINYDKTKKKLRKVLKKKKLTNKKVNAIISI